MLTDLIRWFTSLNPEVQLASLAFLLVVDFPRYLLAFVVMGLWDSLRNLGRWLRGGGPEPAYTHCPSVCVILPGHNEDDTIEATLISLCGSYPRLEIIVIDDGSVDGTSEVVRRFTRSHAEVRLLRRVERGGKASAMNWALGHTRAEVVVCLDADSHLGPNALWEIVQPLKDAAVGAVSGAILARNPDVNLVTRLQAQEYLRSIFLGRLLAARLGILGIISGAFGAFRRSTIEKVGGWNVGPGEDGDLTQAVRKCGYAIAFAPYAQCYTNLPTSWWSLFKQRLRWDRSIVRGKCRQHADSFYFWGPNFRFTDFLNSFENLFLCVICLYGFWGYLVWKLYSAAFLGDGTCWQILVVTWLIYLGFFPVHAALILYYSNDRARDLGVLLPVWPLVNFYQIFLCTARLVAVTGEIVLRKSYEDNFYPERCREATWYW